MPLYIHAPVSGSITALTNYCSGGSHPSTQLLLPTDISASPNTSINLKTSNLVTKITTTKMLDSVCTIDPGDPWDTGVMVQLFASNDQLIGVVFFAHVASAIADGTYAYSSSTGKVIGQVPVLCPLANCPDPDGGGPQGQQCYAGGHVHMEAYSPPGMPTLERSVALTCGGAVVMGMSWIFRINYT